MTAGRYSRDKYVASRIARGLPERAVRGRKRAEAVPPCWLVLWVYDGPRGPLQAGEVCSTPETAERVRTDAEQMGFRRVRMRMIRA